MKIVFIHLFTSCFCACVLRLRTLLKTAKKKLREQDVGGAEFASPMSSLRMDLGRHSQADGAFGRMKEKVYLSDTYCDLV